MRFPLLCKFSFAVVLKNSSSGNFSANVKLCGGTAVRSGIYTGYVTYSNCRIYHISPSLSNKMNMSTCIYRFSNFEATLPLFNSYSMSNVCLQYQCCCHYSRPVSNHGSNSPKQESGNTGKKQYLQLMDFPCIIWPTLMHTFRNWFFANIIIRPYLDDSFTLTSFKQAALQAFALVSNELSQGHFDAIEELLTENCLQEIQKSFSKLSVRNRLDLSVVLDDVFLSFPYQVRIFYENVGMPNQRAFVEITMVYHVFHGLTDYVQEKNSRTGSFTSIYENYDRICIANYRFIREFPKYNEDSPWLINVINYFKPGEQIQN